MSMINVACDLARSRRCVLTQPPERSCEMEPRFFILQEDPEV